MSTIPRSLKERADVHRDTEGSWSKVHLSLPCLARPKAAPRQEVQGSQAVASGQWELLFQAGADVRGGDRAEITGRVWEIIDTNAGRTGARYLVATANAIRPTG